MAISLDIGSKDNLSDIETKVRSLPNGAAGERSSSLAAFRAKVASERRSSFFKDIWVAMAVASGIQRCDEAEVTAWGLKDWSGRDDEDGFALSYASLIALQLGARVVAHAKPPEQLDAAAVKRRITCSGGVLGTGARQRTVVELDPDCPTAAPFIHGSGRRDAFFEYVRGVLMQLELRALARRRTNSGGGESSAKGTIIEFLYELHSNAFEHGRSAANARLLRLQKHQYPRRSIALRHATEFKELTQYLEAQPDQPSMGMFNLVEASISDFGPGIVDGFLTTFAGLGHQQRPRQELLDELLHQQLSSKSSDPNAGLGIGYALAAARELDAFVSLRTGEFWLTMRGNLDDKPRLTYRDGSFPTIVGTHWQLLLPDPTEGGQAGEKRA